MSRLRNALATAAVGAALAAPGAAAQTPPDPPPPPTGGPPNPPTNPDTPTPPTQPPKPKPKPKPKPDPDKKQGSSKQDPSPKPPGGKRAKGKRSEDERGNPGGVRPEAALPPAPGACGPIAIPPALIPIYQRASRAYGLGPAGPSILAAINEIESGFGVNQGPSSAGAIGWMQFMPATWAGYGVDADGDGRRNPWDPDDAIFAAARYLRAGGMPENPEAAIFAYNHADWYVADVLARAACFGGLGIPLLGPGGLSLLPQTSILSCDPAPEADVPKPYMRAFQDAAARYGLGTEGVWALAAVARLESDFGRGMSPERLVRSGPLGLDEWEWRRFAVDGDGDGFVRRRTPADSAATLARLIWSRGGLRAGLFQHNQAAWYVDEVIDEAGQLGGKCHQRPASFAIALPGATSAAILWKNVELSNALELLDLRQGNLDPRILALIGAISRHHRITVSALRSDHSMYTSSGNVSNHYFGRAVDIAAVDGVPCTDTAVDSPCGRLVRQLAFLPAGERPTELIFCFDADGPGPAFAQADHCDHIHAGYDA